MSTTAVLGLTTFCNCKFGLFSHLICNDKSLYTVQRMRLPTDTDSGPLLPGKYHGMRYTTDKGQTKWLLSGDRLTGPKEIVAAPNSILVGHDIGVGLDIGCEGNVWVLTDYREAFQQLNNWLKEVHQFELLVTRGFI